MAGATTPRSRAIVLAAVLAAGLGGPAAGADQVEPLLPDLVADGPGSGVPEIYDFGGGDRRLLLRFDGYVHNRGTGALELRASKPDGTVMTRVEQRAYDGKGRDRVVTASPAPVVRFEQADGHDHWHLQAAARYSLWDDARTAEVAPAQKIGFCLVDSQRMESHGPAAATYTTASNGFCRQGQPGATDVFMGISAGWRDVYGRSLYFQWVDISDVQPGIYRLRSEVDPDGVIVESDEINPAGWAASASTVNGHLALPTDGGETPQGEARALALNARTFDDPSPGSPGPRQFRIESAPAHGTLDRSPGDWFAGPSVVYTPAAGYTGPDSFTFSVRDATSAFPRRPAPAAVTIAVGAARPAVAISGAPEWMYTGTSAQLTATVSNAPDRVNWFVDGKPGGDPFSGRITADGRYTAPLLVPRLGYVTIEAIQPDSGARAQARIAIREAPLAAPAAPTLAVGGAERGRLAPIAFTREADVVVAGTRPGSAGRVVLRMKMRGGRRTCRGRAPAGRAVVCRLRLRRAVRPGTPVRLRARLTRKGRLADERRTRRGVPARHSHP